jgi:Spy/CpxP family protein refolding chaperone
MTKKILVTAVLVGTLATGAFAYNKDSQNSGQRGMKSGQSTQQGMMKRSHKMNKKGMSRHGGMQMFSQLNLSDDQKFQLSILKDEMRLEMKKSRGAKKQGKMVKFVSDDGFDKKAFMAESDSKHTKMMAIKANHMEKVFKILTKEQIAELKKKINS